MRRDDWPERLDESITAARDRPFAWGEHDCVLFTASAVEAMTDVDHAAAWRGEYNSEMGALRVLRKCGFATTAEAAISIFGEAIALLLAQRGDVMLWRGALGICTGTHAAFMTPEGLDFWPIADCDAAWRVD